MSPAVKAANKETFSMHSSRKSVQRLT
jgi:hypothetical protein